MENIWCHLRPGMQKVWTLNTNRKRQMQGEALFCQLTMKFECSDFNKLAVQLDCWDFEPRFSQIHLKKLKSESFSPHHDMAGKISFRSPFSSFMSFCVALCWHPSSSIPGRVFPPHFQTFTLQTKLMRSQWHFWGQFIRCVPAPSAATKAFTQL